MRQVISIAAIVLLVAVGLSSARVTAQEPSLRDLLPSAAEIGPSFVAIDDRARTLGEQAAMFGNPDDAAHRLAAWGWRDNAFVVFQSTELTASGAPTATVDISLTRFASEADAAAALAYFLDDRTAVLGQWEAQSLNQWAGGDELRTIAGPVPGGDDTTVYARSGPLLLRISATAAPGQPAPAPAEIARDIMARFTGQAVPDGAGVARPAAETGLPSLAAFATLPVDNAACFRVAGEGALDLPAMAERLAAGEGVAATLDELGWAGGVYRQFACDPEPGHAGWIDLSVHRFPDDAAAAAAATTFADMRADGMDLQRAPATTLGEGEAAIAGPAVNGTEYTRYTSRGPLLFAVTGVAPEGDPRADVEQIMAALAALPVTETTAATAIATAAIPTSTPYVLGEPVATVVPAPTSTPIPPTPMPPPTTAPAPPMATVIPPTPLPTATPPPTAPPPTATPVPTEPPALIPVAVSPQPTASGPLPTATPRVIKLPTPDGGDG